MAMDLNAKAAYIRGLMTGMEFDPASKNGKVIAAMMDLLEEMAATVTEHDNALSKAYDELETLDQDLDDLVADLYGDDEEDDVRTVGARFVELVLVDHEVLAQHGEVHRSAHCVEVCE